MSSTTDNTITTLGLNGYLILHFYVFVNGSGLGLELELRIFSILFLWRSLLGQGKG